MSDINYSVLYLTDFYYPANGRNYYEEDIYVISKLKDDFEILICSPLHSKNYEQLTDVVIFRNTGAVIYYKECFDEFLKRASSNNVSVYNSLTGKGDMRGKQHLLDLSRENYPVIPTIDTLDDLNRLPSSNRYILKLKNGADSIGMENVTYEELQKQDLRNYIIQPFINFRYEVSFYFIDDTFQYALYAPDKNKRWELKEYTPTTEDLLFANTFIEWNSITHGIQRVDGCRLDSGDLLLVELEDLNPFLSLNAVSKEVKDNFVNNFKTSIIKLIQSKSN